MVDMTRRYASTDPRHIGRTYLSWSFSSETTNGRH
jgi:hypothetical protein